MIVKSKRVAMNSDLISRSALEAKLKTFYRVEDGKLLSADAIAALSAIEEAEAAEDASTWISVKDELPGEGWHDVYAVVKMPAYCDKYDKTEHKENIQVYEGCCWRCINHEYNSDNRYWTFYDDDVVIKIDNEITGTTSGFEEHVTHWMHRYKPEPPKEDSNEDN